MNKIVFLAFFTFACLFTVESTLDVAKEFHSFMHEKFCYANTEDDKLMFLECASMLPRSGLEIMMKATSTDSIFEVFDTVCKNNAVIKKICDALDAEWKDENRMNEKRKQELMECMQSNYNEHFYHEKMHLHTAGGGVAGSRGGEAGSGGGEHRGFSYNLFHHKHHIARVMPKLEGSLSVKPLGSVSIRKHLM